MQAIAYTNTSWRLNSDDHLYEIISSHLQNDKDKASQLLTPAKTTA